MNLFMFTLYVNEKARAFFVINNKCYSGSCTSLLGIVYSLYLQLIKAPIFMVKYSIGKLGKSFRDYNF